MTAFSLIWLPQVGPTSVSDTDCGAMCAMWARAPDTFALSVACWAEGNLVRSAWTWTVAEEPWPRISTVAPGTPAPATALCTWLNVAPWAGISHDVPPLKSIPQLKPLTPNDTRPATMTRPESAYHQRRRPTKSNDVSPR